MSPAGEEAPRTAPALEAEWLEADGLGGFASGTVSGERTRRYHALLLSATTPPTGRMALVNGFDAELRAPGAGRFPLSSQRYADGALHPGGAAWIESFDASPWPTWRFALPGGIRLEQQLFCVHGRSLTAISWRTLGAPPRGAVLAVRPFLSGRDAHQLHRENAAFRFGGSPRRSGIAWRPYDGVPGIAAFSSGSFVPSADWYRSFIYLRERERGLDCLEDLAAPGVFEIPLEAGTGALILAAETGEEAAAPPQGASVLEWHARRCEAERGRRARLEGDLARSADAYIVRRGEGETIVAGYPWFTDWGRDAMIAVRGLCIAAGRLEDARQVLAAWAGAVSEGMLPNRFVEAGGAPEFNSVDASLWFVLAACEYLEAARAAGQPAQRRVRAPLESAVGDILSAYRRGARHGIRMDADGLLRAGEPGVALTWMDARVGEWVVTPRVGKPVEVQALWLNALYAAAREFGMETSAFHLGWENFERRFWNETARHLHDVVDADHEPGKVDASFRPNQIFAAGGLPLPLLGAGRARRVVDACEARLLTPLGLRTLAPGEPGYAPRYSGGPRERDAAYHQGTVWPWLMGPFVQAWLAARGDGPEARGAARERFVEPLLARLAQYGLGHLCEVADAEPPHAPGCPFQAWSLSELIRLDRLTRASRQATPASR